jgi:choline-sulfatase
MTPPEDRSDGLTRKQLLQSGAGAAASVLLAQGAGLERALGAMGSKGRSVAGMNVILFITDQERAIQHFPPGWLQRNLPGMRRLRRHGLSFERAFTNACMCSPARSTLMSGYFPAQHGVKYTLEEDMTDPMVNPQVELPTPPTLPNLATVMRAAGYTAVYKGKWHCSKASTTAEMEQYLFTRWNPPDAGGNQSKEQEGGGFINNDGRYMESVGNPADGSEGVLQYLDTAATKQQPFLLVISLVNPHDVLFYPGATFEQGGYDSSWTEGEMHIPATNGEDLKTKPFVQREFLKIFNLSGKPKNAKQKRAYLNFYGNLMRSSDNYLSTVLAKLDQLGLTDETLVIRTADHGEMGLAHGGLRQKNFNFYEESLRVPLVYSNPKLFPRPLTSNDLVSHVDFVPTLASLVGAPRLANWQGVDYSSLVLNPNRAKPAQDYVVFTYDDYQSGQATPPYPKPPNHIVSLREPRWKLAKYYDVNGQVPPQWEMYDLKTDPLERVNLAYRKHNRTRIQEREYKRLRKKLERIEKTRLRPMPT